MPDRWQHWHSLSWEVTKFHAPFYTQLRCLPPLLTCPWLLCSSVYKREWGQSFRFLAVTSAYLSILTGLTLWQFIGRRHEIHFGSWEARNYVAKLKSKHHKPAFHIYGGNKNKDFWIMMDGKQLSILEREQNKMSGWVWSPAREKGESLWGSPGPDPEPLYVVDPGKDVLPTLVTWVTVWWMRGPVLE